MYVDTHCHLDHHFDLTVEAQVERARDHDVSTVITVGTDVVTSRESVAIAQAHDGVHAVVGLHPNEPTNADDEALAAIDDLCGADVVVGVGETGLDYYRDTTEPDQQRRAFLAHIDLARRHDLALVIHCRDAWDDCLAVLDEVDPPQRVVMHCFSGDHRVVERCAERGWFLSFAGNVTFANAEDLRAAATHAPIDLLLTETDSPYLTPHPHRGRPNDPSFVPLVTRQLAHLHGVSRQTMARHVRENATRAFALQRS